MFSNSLPRFTETDEKRRGASFCQTKLSTDVIDASSGKVHIDTLSAAESPDDPATTFGRDEDGDETLERECRRIEKHSARNEASTSTETYSIDNELRMILSRMSNRKKSVTKHLLRMEIIPYGNLTPISEERPSLTLDTTDSSNLSDQSPDHSLAKLFRTSENAAGTESPKDQFSVKGPYTQTPKSIKDMSKMSPDCRNDKKTPHASPKEVNTHTSSLMDAPTVSQRTPTRTLKENSIATGPQEIAPTDRPLVKYSPKNNLTIEMSATELRVENALPAGLIKLAENEDDKPTASDEEVDSMTQNLMSAARRDSYLQDLIKKNNTKACQMTKTHIPRPVFPMVNASRRRENRFTLLNTASWGSKITYKDLFALTKDHGSQRTFQATNKQKILDHFRSGFGFKIPSIKQKTEQSVKQSLTESTREKTRLSSLESPSRLESSCKPKSRLVLLPVLPLGSCRRQGKFSHIEAKTDCGLYKKKKSTPRDKQPTYLPIGRHKFPTVSSGRNVFNKLSVLPSIQGQIPVEKEHKDNNSTRED